MPGTESHTVSRGLTRRGFLGGLGTLGVLGAAAVTTSCSEGQDDAATTERETAAVPFDGDHQAGIATPPQSHNTTVAFSLRDGADRRAVQRLLRIWTGDARRLCAGTPVLADLEPELASNPGNLTVTCGFGRGLYTAAGIADKAPAWLRPLPHFTGDRLDDSWGDRDIVLQICGDDRTTVSHALRVLVRGGADYARPSWSQTGFLDVQNGTPRNLFGFKDGTVNPHSEKEFDTQVWNDDGGTCMIVRRVAFDMPEWESVDRGTREVAMGRTIVEGAPLSGGDEFTDVDVNKIGDDGLPLIDAHSHVALATSHNGDAERMLRRAYNYDLPVTAGPAGLQDAELIDLSDTGLIFTCFQRDPDTSFIPVQKRLADGDRLNEWITHVGSAVFHVPAGTSGDSYWGEDLLG
ncbi:Dyp-type peroxidase [Corynebacterium glyciniphilum]|uniref:Dyp-type peroxidase n=1 Tax=Corynebacterium glyciniphilum TaxID=1404244 RepID=UPI00069717A8|nr:Dyp-type peroxidase [Corynebacterium glyciniphilum]